MALEGAVDVAKRMGLPLVATSDAHYVDREDAEAQDVLLCINTGKFRTDTNRMRMEGDQFYPPQPGGDVRRASRASRTPSRAARRSPTASTSSSSWASGTFPVFTLPPEQDRRTIICASCASPGLKERYAGDAEMLSGRRAVADGHASGSSASWTSSTSWASRTTS